MKRKYFDEPYLSKKRKQRPKKKVTFINKKVTPTKGVNQKVGGTKKAKIRGNR